MFSIDASRSGQNWDAAAASFTESNFLVSWAYVEAQKNANYAAHTFVVMQDKDVYGVCVAVVRPARRGTFLEVAAPVLKDWNADSISFLCKELRSIGRDNNCVFVRLRPQTETNRVVLSELNSLGLKPALMHLLAEDTQIIDLESSEEDLQSQMRKNTRYEARRAKKQGVQVQVTENSYQNFYDLQKETADRQGYILGNKKLLEAEYKSLSEAGQALLYKARSESGELLNMALIANFNQEADYLYGASTQVGLKSSGAYALQWQAIKDAKAQGFTRYNMWGVAPEGAKNHRFAGVTMFKSGFGGSSVSYVPAHDMPLSKIRYSLVRLVELVRKKRRGL